MPYGSIKVDNIVFTNGGSDQTITVSGLVLSTSGNLTVTGTVSGSTIQGGTLVSGATVTGNTGRFTTLTGGTAGFTTITGTTVTGTTANFVSGVFTTQISGTTVTGTTANFTSGNFTNISGGTHAITSGVFASGTAANPSITFASDLDTGLYSPGADQVAISTNGTGRLFVDASGNVGIGIAPVNNLHVSGGALTRVLVSSTSAGARTDIAFRNSASTVTTVVGFDGTNNEYDYRSGDLVFKYVGSEVARLTSSGRLGLGTSSPDGPLDINVDTGKDVVVGLTSGSPMISYRNGSGAWFHAGKHPTSDYFVISDGGTTTTNQRLVVDNAGRVGIGTTSPATQLHIEGNPANITLRDTDAPSTGYFQIGARGGAGDLAILDVDPNNVIANSVFAVNVDNTERFRITSAGNVGIGTASPGTALDVTGSIRLSGAGPVIELNANGPQIFVPTANALGFATAGGIGTPTERARIDSSGRLLVGASSAYGTGNLQVFGSSNTGTYTNNAFSSNHVFIKSRSTTAGGFTVVQSDDELGGIVFQGTDGSANVSSARIFAAVDGTPGANDMPGRLVFSTTADGASSPTERMRISNTGETYIIASSNVLSISSAAAPGTSVPLVAGRHTGTVGTPGTGTLSFAVWSNGNVVNTNNSYGAISDIKLKENIVDANSQWDDLKALQVRNYNFKEGQTHTQIGLVAQEVELVSPGLVTESPDRDEDGNDLGTVTKSVNYSVLYMKAVKALQEAMERIETLEAKVAALEGL